VDDNNNNSVLLARIDERTKNIQMRILELENELKEHRKKVDNEIFQIDKRLREQYINKDTFLPYQRAIITAISTVVIGVIMAVLNLTIRT